MIFRCSICKLELDEVHFAPCNRKPIMRKRRLCRECSRQENREYHAKNSEKIAARKKAQRVNSKELQVEYAKDYHTKNREKRLRKSRDWHAENRRSVSERHAQWAKENADKRVASVSKRNAMKLQAMPIWADQDAINAFYAEAKRLTDITGIQYHVDHIYPLQGKECCGLHVETNLQILTAADNISKHNKMPKNDHSWERLRSTG